jgi:adenosylcobinamide kinase/adenosylcobinamide-phosphate guanylyltransferase
MGTTTFVTGGARSGKSRFAETLAREAGGRVVYLATMQPGDDETAARIQAHRARRPSDWLTVEEPLDPETALSRVGDYDVCLLDCLTLWLSNLLLAGPGAPDEAASAAALERVRGLLTWQAARESSLIVVSNEVGAGIVPENPLGRLFRDLLGEANQLVAAASGRAYLCAAGYAVDLKALGRPVKD